MIGPDVKGERIALRLMLLDGDGAPVPDGMIELWQADAAGEYRNPNDPFCGFGRLGTDPRGVCLFETIRPGRVAGENGSLSRRRAHQRFDFCARPAGSGIVTRVYFCVGDPALEEDAVLALVPADRRHTLIAQPASARAARAVESRYPLAGRARNGVLRPLNAAPSHRMSRNDGRDGGTVL